MYFTLNRCRYVISSYMPLTILEDANIVVDGGKIVCIGECHGYNNYDRIDCREKVAAPAFGNAHIHTASILKYVGDLDLRRAITMAMINMASNGIAAFQSMDEEYIEIINAAKNIGLRVRAGPVIKSEKCESFNIEGVSYNLYSPIISIENLLEIDEEALKSCMENLLNKELDIQIPVSRTVEEVLKFKRRKGLLPVEYLARNNLLSGRVVLSHVNWISSWELESIVHYRPRVAICPYSDVLSGINGIPPIKTLLEKNVIVGIGTETFIHRGSSNMLKDISSIVALYRYSNTDIEVEQVMQLATQGSYSVMNINAGTIEVGREADIAILSVKRMKYSVHTKRVLPLIIHESYVDSTIVNGSIVWSVDEMDRYTRLLDSSRYPASI
ncbi:MAG: amidohydrolase family protein [Ignisphaera sp.]|nr:amidohydrolase family protein [Ignisphaera sp.]MCX8168517.1 amidohydrolase family protein [Ignisphaera sp.]MDW8085044.1 amidohydrolase family protein [Ignisphaera sp.]